MQRISTKLFFFFCSFLFTFSSFSAQSQTIGTGDLACVGFNADGNDDLSFVALAAIPAGSVVYFRDDEWDGAAFNTGESAWSWNSGAAVISAGAIIAFSNFGTPTATANLGTLTAAIPTNFGIAAGGDAVFVYQGADVNTPTRFITVVTNGAASTSFTSLAGTGLTEGTTALVLTPVGLDIAAYRGAKTGLDKSGYIAAINNMSNWDNQDGTGDQHNDGITPDVPFSLTPFTFGTAGDVTPPSVLSAVLESATTFKLTYSESVTRLSAQKIVNHTFTPTATISSIVYDSTAKTAILTVGALTVGRKYRLSVNNLVDLSANTQTTPSVFDGLYVNNYAGSDLVISEIMYNPATNGDTLEFLELYNNSNTAIPIGGLRFTEGLLGSFPEHTLAGKTAVSMALDTAAFRRFYGVAAIGQWATGQALGNGGEKLTITNTLGGIVDSLTYDDAAPWVLEPDGTGPSLEIINPSTDNALASNWRASKTATGKSLGTTAIFASPNVLPVAAVLPEVNFELRAATFSEPNIITVNVTLKNPNGQPTSIEVLLSPNTKATSGVDFNFSTQVMRFSGDTAAAARTLSFSFFPVNDGEKEADEYIVLDLKTPTNATIGTNNQLIAFITDDDSKAPTRTNELKINQLTSYKNGAPANNSAEIVAYDVASKRLFIANSIGGKIDIVDFSNPSVPRAIRSISLQGIGGVNSIVAQGGVIAAAIEDSIPTNPGKVIFLDTAGTIINRVNVGVLPDMIAITPDGKYVLTADEAQPNDAYTIDPEGSVSIIDISAGVFYVSQTDVTVVNFKSLNPLKSQLQTAGIRIFGKMKDSTTTVTVAQDLEPEYIAISPDSKRAVVTLQENNAVIAIDIVNKRIESVGGVPVIVPLGYKNHTLPQNAFDASDQATAVNLTNWNVRGVYMPDGIATLETNGQTYYVTANEGDARAYAGLNEESSVANIRLDPAKFPDSTTLRGASALGRMVITNASGDTDGDGDFDEIHTFGGRSITIWNSTGQLVWDSGDWMERITKDSTYFNASNGAGVARKNRSRAKGPEPEGVAIGTLGGQKYAFIALERTGGVMVFNVTNPTAPTFTTYTNPNRKGVADDDRGPEGIIFIPSAQSPNGKNLLLVANEISSSVAVFEIDATATPVNAPITEGVDFAVYPNPVATSDVFFSREVTGTLVNIVGQTVRTFQNQTQLNVSNLENGTYFIVSKDRWTKKIVVQK